MSNNYDNWERLVAVVLRREHDRQLALADSRESSFRSTSSSFSLVPDSPFHEQNLQQPDPTPHEEFESRLSIKKKIKEALKDDEISIIGICGMAGVGKTTLAKEIVDEVKVEKLFEEVAFADISYDIDIIRVQNQLAEMLGLRIEDRTSEIVRAERLRQRFDGKSVLVILDDVWEEIDLRMIGIQLPRDDKGLKIMFTTRIEDTCRKMGGRTFKIEVLGELAHILAQSKQRFELDLYEESILANEGDTVQEEYVMDLVHPDVVPRVTSIANIMFAAHHDLEFCQAFVRFWRDELAEYMTILKVEQYSIEDVLKMEWTCLSSRIRKWRRAIKNVIEIYLISMKRLFGQVLAEYGSVGSTCLVEASQTSLLCLLNFGHAVTIGPHQPQWLYLLLDTYEDLASLIPGVEYLFPDEAGSFIRIEFHELLRRLGDAAKVIFMEFGNYIQKEPRTSRMPYANGGILPLTRYVVNYILIFMEYGGTLNSLLAENDGGNLDTGHVGQTTISCPVAVHLHSVTSILEANLDIKSNLYRESSLKHIFMMNNIHYMVSKIKNSEVRSYFGDNWIRENIGKFQQHAMGYQRITWRSILGLIRDDGRSGKATLKERCRDFSIAFEDMYKIQTAWVVPNLELREELRISASKTVIPAYRNFVGKITSHIGEKYIKYSVNDLETYILDLLDGSQKSLKPSRMKEATILNSISLFPSVVISKMK